MALFPTTKQASLNQDAMKSIRRVRSTDSTDINKWWCVERNTTRFAFEIQKELIDTFDLKNTIHPQVSRNKPCSLLLIVLSLHVYYVIDMHLIINRHLRIW